MSDILYCDVCDIKLSSIYALRKHLKTNLHKKKLNPVSEKYSCLCGRKYTHRPGLYKHRKNCDTYINRQEGENVEQAENEKEEKEVSHEPLLKKIEDLEKKLLEEKVESQKKEIDSLKKVAMLENKLASATKITKNTTNNITNNNNITIHAFGEENIDYITIRELIQFCNDKHMCIPNLIENTHFHPDHPENHNVRLPNKKLKYCQIMRDNKWETIPKDDAYSDMKSNAFQELSDTNDKHENKRIKERFEEFAKKFHNDKKTNKIIDQRIDMLFSNKT
jgi:hypothetical protein